MAVFTVTPTETTFNVQVGENTLAAANFAAAAQASAEAAARSAQSLSLDAIRLTQGLISDVFVSSRDGSDTATGLSYPRARQTLASASSLLSSTASSLALISGSYWREQLNIADGREVASAGAGNIPVIDGSDIVTGWTAEGTANVWQKTGWTHTLGSSSNRFIVIEDGQILTRVANVAACSSTPGSFVDVRASAGSPVTLRIHPTGSGNPNTNGRLYEASRREYAMSTAIGDDAAVLGPIETRASLSNNGSFAIRGTGQVSRVLATHGTKHNFFLAEGTARDCISYLADKPTADELSNTMFVSYQDDPSGKPYAYERAGAVQPLGAGSAFSGTLAFFGHGSNPSLLYASGEMRQCWGVGAVFAGHPGGASTLIEQGCYWRALTFISNVTRPYKLDQTVAYIFAGYDGAGAATTTFQGHEIENCAIFFEKRTSAGGLPMRMDGGANVFDRVTLVMGGPGAFAAHAYGNSASSGSVTCNNSVIVGFSGYLHNIPSDVSYTGNNNIYWSDNEFAPTRGFIALRNGAEVTSLADWQTATGQDSNSVYALRADQVAGDADALFLGWAQAAPGTDLNTVGPAVGDFRLNPTAKLYNAAGAVRTGTLADGTTPIVGNVGQQLHWNWNKGASVSGPARRFPVVPVTLEECRDYIAAPAAWEFYP